MIDTILTHSHQRVADVLASVTGQIDSLQGMKDLWVEAIRGGKRKEMDGSMIMYVVPSLRSFA